MAWYQALMALNSAIKEFICENCNELVWSGKEDSTGAEAYFASVTSPDQLTDFAISSGSGAPASGASASAKPVAAGANSAEADALASALQGPLAAFKTAAAAVGNDSAFQACQWFAEAMNDQVVLVRTMASF